MTAAAQGTILSLEIGAKQTQHSQRPITLV
jgi:hypothetical protein